MRAILILAALAACTTDDDPARELAKVETCDQGVFEGEPIDHCAAACVNAPFASGPTDCRVPPSSNSGDTCDSALAFERDGVRGCCDNTTRVDGKPTLLWRECLE
jgi:hypothetical protein